jgi:hypothetical protein
MSDFLKTPVANIASTKWSAGEQPTAGKFRFLFNSYYSALNAVCKILGPLENDNQAISTPGNIISSYNYGRMSAEEKNNLVLNAESSILNTFNLARIIGPHASLNPTYLPGSVHLVASQGNGWLLQQSKIQQLPFPPHTESALAYEYDSETELYTCNYNVEIWTDGVESTTWLPVGSPKECLSSIDKLWHLAQDGTLYSSQAFGETEYIKYDLYVPNTFGVLGSGYNAIPDLSIFSLTEEDRQTLYNTDDEYGAIILSYVTTSGSRSKWRVKLPKIISSKDSLTSLNDRGVSATLGAGSFEPFGEFITDGKYYVLNSDIYIAEDGDQPNTLTENVLALYDTNSGRTYSLGLSWDKTSDKRELYFYGPLSLKDRLFANDGVTLLSSNIALTNSKNFVLFCLGTNLSDTVSQNTLNYARHRHNGIDSYRVSHRDLLEAEGNFQGFFYDQEGFDGGLDFINFNRQLAFSEVKDNPHTQYLNRLGYRFGGSQGLYGLAPDLRAVDLNAMHGDLIFYPIYKNEASYYYANLSAYNAANKTQKITWDLTDLGEYGTDDFTNRRGHAIMFGWPALNSGKKYSEGATKLYYESHNFLNSSQWDNTGNEWSLWRHGFIPGNSTGTESNYRGLNIGWGNLFFGYREDVLNGRLTQSETKTEASAFWRTSEFNIVTTGNNQAGNNTNSEIKDGYAYRDGFNVRAVKGSNVWLSVGSPSVSASLAKNTDNNPGTISLEASFLAYPSSTNGGANGLVTLNEFKEQGSSGAGIFTSPGARGTFDGSGIENRIPWATKIPNDYNFAQLWDNDVFTVVKPNLWTTSYSPGPLLDIFNLAPDANKKNIDSGTPGITTTSFMNDIAVYTDSNLGKWPFGRPLLRGTYGIDFCVSGQLDNLSSDFMTGFDLKNEYASDSTDAYAWGPTRSVLYNSENEFIHREFRFWGKNSSVAPTSSDSYLDTQGGNINLLYGFGKNYRRFGKILNVADGSSHLSGGNQTTTSPWLNSRSISMGSSNPANYGSAIRNASYVDAFQGIRHDPLQPYVAEYVYPFRATIDLAMTPDEYFLSVNTTTGDLAYDNKVYDITYLICGKNIIILNDVDPIVDANYYMNKTVKAVIQEGIANQAFTSSTSLPSIDALIRGSEEIFLQNSVTSYSNAYPRCLVDFKINLDYFTGKQIIDLQDEDWSFTSTNDESKNTPHSGPNGLTAVDQKRSFGRVLFGYNVMVPASGRAVTAAGNIDPFGGGTVESTEGLNRISVVMSNRQPIPYMLYDSTNPDNQIDINFKNNPNVIVGYQDFLGTMQGNSSIMASYNNGFPLYKKTYGAALEHDYSDFRYDVNTTGNAANNIFIPIVNIPDFWYARTTSGTDDRWNFNFSMPYRVYVASETGKPVYRNALGHWQYKDGSTVAYYHPEDPLVGMDQLKVMVELRGKIIIKVVTSPVENVIVD